MRIPSKKTLGNWQAIKWQLCVASLSQNCWGEQKNLMCLREQATLSGSPQTLQGLPNG